jgi:polyisoprenoid-binding protein YceI
MRGKFNEQKGTMKYDPASKTAEGSIKRSDYGVNYGIPTIGEVMDLQIEVETIMG